VESGISLENAIFRVSQEMKQAQPALADELAFTWAEISILPSRDQALENLADRVDIPTVRSVVGTLAQSLRYGSPLAQALRGAAAEMRNEQLMLLEERANRLPALMTIPVMVLIMPTIFLIVGGPAVIRMLDIFWGQQ
jgi:tight adherence protein C